MNLIFHLGSAVAAVMAIWVVLKLRRERDLLRTLLTAGIHEPARDRGPRRVVVEAPATWMKAVASAAGIPFENEIEAKGAVPARIEAKDIVDIFTRRGLALIRWTAPDSVELHVRAQKSPAENAAAEERCRTALGGATSVRIIERVSIFPVPSP